jgi:GNAT superfamily N-acetyltransferase
VTTAQIEWRGDFENGEVNLLHSQAFNTGLHSDGEWDWRRLVHEHSLGWVTARLGTELVGFANVITDGFVHSWLQDVMVAPARQRTGLGTAVVREASEQAAEAGCEWLHVDFDDDVAGFYLGRCGFQPTSAGLLRLRP